MKIPESMEKYMKKTLKQTNTSHSKEGILCLSSKEIRLWVVAVLGVRLDAWEFCCLVNFQL